MLKVAGKQSIGERDTQEDAFQLVSQNEHSPSSDMLMILADGMGGHAAGEVASQTACQAFAQNFVSDSTTRRPRARLENALDAANAALARKIAQDPSLIGMGCTLIGALKMENRLVWVSVGDSILYLLRRGKLLRKNADHSIFGELMELVQAGKLSRQDAESNPKRHALRSAVKGDNIALRDVNGVDLQQGDIVLLASDGIETLSESEIVKILTLAKDEDVRALASDLLNAVDEKKRPRQDNTTVILYRHDDGRQTAFSRLTAGHLTTLPPSLRRNMIGLGLAGLVVVSAVTVWALSSLFPGGEMPAPDTQETATQGAPDTPSPQSNPIGDKSGDKVENGESSPSRISPPDTAADLQTDQENDDPSADVITPPQLPSSEDESAVSETPEVSAPSDADAAYRTEESMQIEERSKSGSDNIPSIGGLPDSPSDDSESD